MCWVKLSGGRIVEATIKAIVDTTDGVRLQVSFGEETALIYLWQVVKTNNTDTRKSRWPFIHLFWCASPNSLNAASSSNCINAISRYSVIVPACHFSVASSAFRRRSSDGSFSSMPASFAKSRKRSESVRWSDMDTTTSSGLLTMIPLRS